MKFAQQLAWPLVGLLALAACVHIETEATAAPRQWTEPVRVDSYEPGYSDNPQIAVDRDGNVMAVWVLFGERMSSSIWASRWTPEEGWGVSELIQVSDRGAANVPLIVFDQDGNATAAWWHNPEMQRYNNMWSNRWSPGEGWWEAPVLIGAEHSFFLLEPAISIDTAGNVFVVWSENNSLEGGFSLWSNRWTKGNGWGAALAVDTEECEYGLYPQIAVSSSGAAMAVWRNAGPAGNRILASRWTDAQGWEPPSTLSPAGDDSAGDPQIAFTPSGDAIVVWVQSIEGRNRILSNQYSSVSGWTGFHFAENLDRGDSSSPDLSIDDEGNAMVVWTQGIDSQCLIYSSFRSVDADWETETCIESSGIGNSLYADLAFDSTGAAIAVWNGIDGSSRAVYASRWTRDSGWEPPIRININETPLIVGSPRIVIDRSGCATVVWPSIENVETLSTIRSVRLE